MTDPKTGYDIKVIRSGSGKLDTTYSARACKDVYKRQGIIVTPEEAQKEMDIFFGQHPKLKTLSLIHI